MLERDASCCFSLDLLLLDETEDEGANGGGDINAVTNELCISERSREALF